MITRIEHIGLMAKDTRSLARWYRENLGFEEVFSSAGTPEIFFLKLGEGMLLELFPWKDDFQGPLSHEERQVSHICLYSTDFDKDLANLKDRGVTISGEVKHLFGEARAVFFLDEEGNYLHLVHRPEVPWEK